MGYLAVAAVTVLRLMCRTGDADSCCVPARQNHVGEVLKRAGVSVLLTSLCNVMAFLSAAILPIPALRYFALQVSPRHPSPAADCDRTELTVIPARAHGRASKGSPRPGHRLRLQSFRRSDGRFSLDQGRRKKSGSFGLMV